MNERACNDSARNVTYIDFFVHTTYGMHSKLRVCSRIRVFSKQLQNLTSPYAVTCDRTDVISEDGCHRTRVC